MPSLILRSARLPGSDDIVDVQIVDGVITRIGYVDPTEKSDRTVQVGERWIIPGLWDNHVHFTQWAQTTRRLDLSRAASAAETAVLVGERMLSASVAEDSRTDTFVGTGFRDGLWPDQPSCTVLDAVSGETPVVLVSGDLHSCWVNSAALLRYGFAGHPTGLLREEEAFEVVRALDTVSDAVTDTWVQEAARAAAARGVVGVVDLEMTWNLDAWTRRMAAGTDSLRVKFGIYSQHLDRAIALGLRTGDVVPDTGGLLQVGPFKVITDGSLNTRTAYCFDDYPNGSGHGLLTVPQNELLERMLAAARAGLTPAVHAIGDHANRLALDAFEAIGCAGGIEHAQLLADEDIARFARLGIVASVQPEHAMDDRDVADHYWAGRTDRAFPLASLLRAGVTLALGSDAPVAPLDPWITLAAAVGRSRDGREPWHPEQSISRQAGLAASAQGRHRIAVGDVADLAVCEIDPLTASVADVRRMPVAATVLAGRFTHNTL
ncbi:amidohydrolase [Cryobacterium sp. MLB-32]|uniref:amidohydrolase n=1 Tax=Cryobacterium sp. MLB-32 TaxID=1529318 RepID=UPI0004E6C27A|nr:amidohydrolase family protein [Cryobacterium sp. MLB-32]KFF59246.1 amidohydrolase [Cryobacterium sp. MLB-32]